MLYKFNTFFSFFPKFYMTINGCCYNKIGSSKIVNNSINKIIITFTIKMNLFNICKFNLTYCWTTLTKLITSLCIKLRSYISLEGRQSKYNFSCAKTIIYILKINK